MFINLPQTFEPELTKKENTDEYKMQELVSAYLKVFKYNLDFFVTLKIRALKAMEDPKKKIMLNHWLSFYDKMDNELRMRSDAFYK